MNSFKLLGRVTSSNVRKVLWAADEMGLSYEREDWGLPLRDPNVPEFLALNPNAQVPVLIDGRYVLWESNAILSYLARKAGSPLLPEDIEAQGLVEQWLSWQTGELNPSWVYAVQKLIRKNPAYDDPGRLTDSIAKWTGKMRILEGHLEKGKPFITGAEFTIADIALGISVHRWFCADFVKASLPAVADYHQRLKQRPAAAAYMSDATP